MISPAAIFPGWPIDLLGQCLGVSGDLVHGLERRFPCLCRILVGPKRFRLATGDIRDHTSMTSNDMGHYVACAFHFSQGDWTCHCWGVTALTAASKPFDTTLYLS
jgi:hypothetical protein